MRARMRAKVGARARARARARAGARAKAKARAEVRAVGCGLWVRSTRWSVTVDPQSKVRQGEEAVRKQLGDARVAPGVATEGKLASQR